MKCPFCDTEMIHGYLNCGIAIYHYRMSCQRFSCVTDYKEPLPNELSLNTKLKDRVTCLFVCI